jgi:hypothetical protein
LLKEYTMRASLLLVVLLSASLLVVAQEDEQPQSTGYGADVTPSAAQNAPTPAASGAAKPAPVLGHPLDPADVAVLSGKSDTTVPPSLRSPYAAATGYAPPYMYDYQSSGWAERSGQRPFLSPFFFGGSRGRAFFGGFPHHPAFFFFRRH